MTTLDFAHDPRLRSWVTSAESGDFPLQNLPFGVAAGAAGEPHRVVRIKFIFVSSVKAATDTVANVLYEDNVPDPKTDNGKSKLAAERYIQSAQFSSDDKLFYILRPCMIHGPGNKGNLNLLYKITKAGLPYPLAASENQRSFLSIDNLSCVINELIKSKHIPSGIYNVADDIPLSTNRVIKIMGEEISKGTRLLLH